MYLPAHFEVKNIGALHDVMVKYPLGTWVAVNGTALTINHIPFLLDAEYGTHGRLIGHVARANPAWKQLGDATTSVVIFHAEQGYISPNWYPSKQHDPGVVPTWNYAVVHVQGRVRAIEDKEWLLKHVTALTNHHEGRHDHAWHISDAPEEYIERRLSGIVGIEFSIESLIGKFKLSQNRSDTDKDGVIAGMQTRDDAAMQALSRRMKQVRK